MIQFEFPKKALLIPKLVFYEAYR